jgi:hypothetical protein
MDAAAEKACMIGRCFIADRPTSAKTISSSGGKIHFRTGAVTWGTSGTTVRVGIQDVSPSAGPTGEPDGTFDVHGDLVQGTDSLSANTWTTVSMSSGTKDITHGQLIAVVLDMTTRNGSDSVVLTGRALQVTENPPFCRAFTTSWQAASANNPNVVIEFDDGTFASFFGAEGGFASSTTENFGDATNPDERGMMFRVPFPCIAEGAMYFFNTGGAAGDYTFKLYSDPTGSPVEMYSEAILAEQNIASAGRYHLIFATPQYLKPNVDYGMTLRITGSGIILPVLTFGAAAYRALQSGGTTTAKITRNNDSGAFSTTTTAMYVMTLLISAVDVGPSPIYQLGL